MDQRFRKTALAAAIFTTIATASDFSNIAWAKKQVHIEPPVTKVNISSPKSMCPEDYNGEIAKRMGKPRKTDEFLNMVSEITPAYHRPYNTLLEEVDKYIADGRRSKWKDNNYLKIASKLEKLYQDRIRNAINSFAVPEEERKKEILDILRKCHYLFTESATGAIASRFAKDDAIPKPPREDPTLWHVVKPEVQLSKEEIESLRKKSELDSLMDARLDSDARKR